MILRPKEWKSILETAQKQSVSMRRRLMLYLFTIMLFFALLIAILLLLFGAIDPIGYEIEWALDNQLEDSVNDIEHQSNNQAAYTFAFSKQLSAAVEMTLQMPKSPSTSSAILPMHWNPCRAGFLRLSTPICCLHPAAVHFTF